MLAHQEALWLWPEPQRPTGAVCGYVAPGFEPVRDAFAENFSRRGEVGAGFCAYLGGRKIVDLWGGYADPAARRPWGPGTLSVIFSATKGLLAACLLHLADRGRLDYDAPVARYWPEFGCNGKEPITVRDLLNHRSGLCAIDQRLSFGDFSDSARIHAALIQQRPLWEPGKDQGYGPISMGVYAAELFRRVAGEGVGRYLAREIAAPLGADVHIGLDPDSRVDVSRLIPVRLWDFFTQVLPSFPSMDRWEARMLGSAFTPTTYTRRALTNPSDLGLRGIDAYGKPEVQRMEMPWANGLASARGLARVYAALAGGGRFAGARICSPDAILPLHARQSWARDRVMFKEVGFSQGFMKEEPHLFSPAPESFGHPGAGGAVGFADPTRELAFGYVMNRMSHRLRSPRAQALCRALYGCL